VVIHNVELYWAPVGALCGLLASVFNLYAQAATHAPFSLARSLSQPTASLCFSTQSVCVTADSYIVQATLHASPTVTDEKGWQLNRSPTQEAHSMIILQVEGVQRWYLWGVTNGTDNNAPCWPQSKVRLIIRIKASDVNVNVNVRLQLGCCTCANFPRR
jgi:hypothetical protein